ncbi:MAG: biopolymer transporter ExbD, partial [Pseudomonadota bacterium]|nr:biopolymer transporter ExbD [Pseudomonadota bacterium]
MAIQANGGNQSRGTGQRGRYRPLSEINVTPFVDVMLVLLIVFMVTAPLLTVGVDVNLPTNDGDDLPDGKIFYVSIKSNGSVYLQNQKVPLGKVAPRMQAVFKANPELTVYFRGDRN